jgi:hypothetical protein
MSLPLTKIPERFAIERQRWRTFNTIADWKHSVIFIPHRQSWQPNTISPENNDFMENVCRRQQQNVLRSSCKELDFLTDPKQVWIFSTYFSRSHQHNISRKFVWQEPGWFVRTEGRTDTTKPTGVLSYRRTCLKRKEEIIEQWDVWT